MIPVRRRIANADLLATLGEGAQTRLLDRIDLMRRVAEPIKCDWCAEEIRTEMLYLRYSYEWPPGHRAKIHEWCRKSYDLAVWLDQEQKVASAWGDY